MTCQFIPHLVLFVCLATVGGVARGAEPIRRTPDTEAALRYQFTPADNALLDEVQYACFQYFWKEVGSPAALAKDRLHAPVASIAAVGFQLSSLPIGVERGWITRAQGSARAATILGALLGRPDNRKFGIYLHYPDMDTAGLSQSGFEILAGTIDHALLLAGALTAGEYFGDPVRPLADRMAAESNWRAFAVARDGLLSMGWKPDDTTNMAGPGTFLEARWHWASDEERLLYFIAVGAPDPAHALPPELYYRMERVVKRHKDLPPHVVSYPGTLFTYFFSHCWIDFRGLDADDPAAFGGVGPSVDWFENSRRAVLTHRQRCIEMADKYKTLAPHRWGLSACSARDGYIVPEIRPNTADRDNWFEGTVAPYAAGSAIMFTPAESMAALHEFRQLRDDEGSPLIWRDPRQGGYGFVDSFNLDQRHVCEDYVGIDQGPLLVAIENARTGLIWRLFMQTDTARRAVERLKLTPLRPTTGPAATKPATP